MVGKSGGNNSSSSNNSRGVNRGGTKEGVMGQGSSKPEELLVDLPEEERYFGLENFGNTCYCNSVLQSLYYCKDFRDRVVEYRMRGCGNGDEDILQCLGELFVLVSCCGKLLGWWKEHASVMMALGGFGLGVRRCSCRCKIG